MVGAPRFILLSRSYCHLCQDMLDALLAMRDPGAPFTVDVIDIDAPSVDGRLLTLYDELVPVLFGARDQAPLCHYFIDKGKVEAYLSCPG